MLNETFSVIFKHRAAAENVKSVHPIRHNFYEHTLQKKASMTILLSFWKKHTFFPEKEAIIGRDISFHKFFQSGAKKRGSFSIAMPVDVAFKNHYYTVARQKKGGMQGGFDRVSSSPTQKSRAAHFAWVLFLGATTQTLRRISQ